MHDNPAAPAFASGRIRYHVIVNPARILATKEVETPRSYETREAAEGERDRLNGGAGGPAYMVIATSD